MLSKREYSESIFDGSSELQAQAFKTISEGLLETISKVWYQDYLRLFSRNHLSFKPGYSEIIFEGLSGKLWALSEDNLIPFLMDQA